MDGAQKMKNIFAKNLKLQIERRGTSQTIVSEKLGIPKMTMSNWLNAKTYPRADKLQMLATYFNISRSDLTEEKPTNFIPLEPRTVRVPILGKISCGDPIDAIENIEGYIMKTPEDVQGGEFVAAFADGESMSPTIPNGAIVTIRRQPIVENGEIVAALVNGDEQITLKRYRRQGDTVLLTPDNPNYDTIIVDKKHPVKIIGKVTGYEVKF